MSEADDLQIRLVNGQDEAWACADIMASTDPWMTLGRSRENTFGTVTHPLAETYVAVNDQQIVGVVIVVLKIPLIRGYIMGLAVHADHRNRGIGSKLMAFAEERIFRESPNVFLCASSFNAGAQRLYERLGYRRVGEIENFAIDGAGEILMRKTLGPISTFKPLG
jgi:ribosomal-protein-alanine N-acetyltransferase